VNAICAGGGVHEAGNLLPSQEKGGGGNSSEEKVEEGGVHGRTRVKQSIGREKKAELLLIDLLRLGGRGGRVSLEGRRETQSTARKKKAKDSGKKEEFQQRYPRSSKRIPGRGVRQQPRG